jgi:hypothetical protein
MPGSHQVASALTAPGYVIAAVPPAPTGAAAPANRTPLYAGLAAAAVVVAAAAFLLARRLRAAPEGADDDEDHDEDDDEDEDPEGDGPGGMEERR